MIYTNESGVEVPIQVVGVKNSSWLFCLLEGKEQLIHRKYIVATKGNAEIEEAMNKVTDNNVN